MMPNKTKLKDEDTVLFQCSCGGKHFLEVSKFNDEDKLWVSFVDYPNGIWEAIKWYFHNRKMFVSELELDKEDVKELIKVLNKYLKV